MPFTSLKKTQICSLHRRHGPSLFFCPFRHAHRHGARKATNALRAATCQATNRSRPETSARLLHARAWIVLRDDSACSCGTTCMVEERRIILVQLLAGARMPPAAGRQIWRRSMSGERKKSGCRAALPGLWTAMGLGSRLGQVCGRRRVPAPSLSVLGPRRTTCRVFG